MSEFDRCPLAREHAEWLDERIGDAQSRWLLLEAGTLRQAVGADGQVRVCERDISQDPGVFLGRIGEHHYFARVAADADAVGQYRELRELADNLSPAWLEMLGMARSLLAWHQSHRYCGHCGSETASRLGGLMRHCSRSSCAREVFPRTDPAIIVLISSGPETLLVNKPSWPENRRSVVAGFVDPAETMEDAVRREVLEETGIRTGQVRYLRSQGWPYPGSLMLACEVEALSRDINVAAGQELRAAEWYSREQLQAGVEAGSITLPPVQAVSRWLIDHWLEKSETA